jgi:hypothetical protein
MKAQPKSRKIFLYNMNTWFSNFVIDSLRSDIVPQITANEFTGTCGNSEVNLPQNFLPKIIKIESSSHYDQEVFSNDVFIFNLEDTGFEHIEYIVKGLKTLNHKTEKTLIIVSSIMTWARTSPKVKKEPIEEEPQGNEEKEDVSEKEIEQEGEPEQVSEDEEIIDELDEEEIKEMEENNNMEGDEGIEKEPPVNGFNF